MKIQYLEKYKFDEIIDRESINSDFQKYDNGHVRLVAKPVGVVAQDSCEVNISDYLKNHVNMSIYVDNECFDQISIYAADGARFGITAIIVALYAYTNDPDGVEVQITHQEVLVPYIGHFVGETRYVAKGVLAYSGFNKAVATILRE